MNDIRKIASIIIPVLNEAKYIESCINSIVFSTKGIEEMELIIIDGGSKDDTLSIVKNLIKSYSYIKLFHNERQTTPISLNIGIKNSSGKYIIRLDAHAEYAPGYINKCIESLENSSEDIANIGGNIITKPGSSTIIGKSIAQVLSSRIGVGNSTFRVEKTSTPKFVETVPFGAFKREALEEVGLFNENEPRNEDLELNRRLIKSGKKILLDPNINSKYYSREDYKSFIKQQFDNGLIVTNKYRGKNSFHELRHFIPLIFVAYIIVLLIMITCSILNVKSNDLIIVFSLPFFIYCLSIIIMGINHTIKKLNPMYLLFIPLTFILLHFSYGLGSLRGIFLFKKYKL